MMNRKMALGIALIVMAIASSCAPKADPETDFEAEAIDGGKGVAITGYLGNKWEVVIPSKIQGLPVIWIDNNAFQKKSLIKVTIPNSVVEIGESAFANNQLTSINIPKRVTTIGPMAFRNNQLTDVSIPISVTKIWESAFADNKLTSVTIGSNADVFPATPAYMATFGMNGFEDAYNDGGKLAGTYTRPNTNTAIWTKQ